MAAIAHGYACRLKFDIFLIIPPFYLIFKWQIQNKLLNKN